MSAACASDGLLSIGEVLRLLRADFPDVTISKIRYLETEGLVEPAAHPSGYRKFTRADADGCATCCGCSATTTCPSR